MTAYRSIRRGITLIEMMVAMALALGIMLILTESFKMALDFVRGAHSTGELMSQLNSAGLLLTRDLQADHFTDVKTPTTGPRLSDQRLDDTTTPWAAPADPLGGFFRIYAPDPGVEPTSPDPQGFKINLPAVNHHLHFTAVLPIGASASSFTESVNGHLYSSEIAEIAYFLDPMPGKKTSVGAGGQQLYNLIRRQKLVAKSTTEQPALASETGMNAADYASVISQRVTPSAAVNTVFSVMTPANRMPLTPFPSGPRFGEDIVVSNVLSFEVQADWTPGGATPAPRAFASNSDAPYDFLPAAAPANSAFDTGVAPLPMTARIKSLQIVIRVYDPRVKTTRQNTWKFAM